MASERGRHIERAARRKKATITHEAVGIALSPARVESVIAAKAAQPTPSPHARSLTLRSKSEHCESVARKTIATHVLRRPSCLPSPRDFILFPETCPQGILMATSLFSPIKLAGVELDNRIVVSPMCQYSADDGCANDWHMTHLGMLANSGAGLLVVEATHVERHGRITHGCLGLYSDDCEAALAHVIDTARRYGTTKFGIQLAHAGRKASAQLPWDGGAALKGGEDPWETIAPTALPFGPGWPVPREMTTADIERARGAFVATATRAVRIGFDAIELHAHGYLMHSFMSPLLNRRTDQYGGSYANRMRFPLCAGHAQQSGGESPLPNLMEVKG
jgi:hypothetical protein